MLPVRSRHILMTVDAVGGVWTYALDLGAALQARGDRVTLAVLGPDPSDAQRAEAVARGLSVVRTGHAPEWLASDAAAVRAGAAALRRLARRQRADVLHLNHPALAAAAGFDAPVLAVCHSCLATWWDAVRGGALPDDFRWRAVLHEEGLARADAVVAPSGSFAEATRRVYGFGLAPGVVPNGRAAPAIEPADDAPVSAAFTAGRLWDEGKDIGTLDRAAARMSVAVEAAGPLRGPNGAEVAVHHLRPLGALREAEVRGKLAGRPVFVSTAIYEPFGLAVLEAAQAGCALVLSDIPTFREVWGHCAAFVPPHDDAALAAAVTSLVEDPDRRARMADLSLARSARFTAQACAEATGRAYAAAIVARGGARSTDDAPRRIA